MNNKNDGVMMTSEMAWKLEAARKLWPALAIYSSPCGAAKSVGRGTSPEWSPLYSSSLAEGIIPERHFIRILHSNLPKGREWCRRWHPRVPASANSRYGHERFGKGEVSPRVEGLK